MKEGNVLRVYKPVAQKATLRVLPAERPASLNNKKIALAWNGKPGGDVALERVAEGIQKAFPEAKFEKHFYAFPFTKPQIEHIRSGCDVAVGATGD